MEIEPRPDGTFIVSVVGRRRCRVLSLQDQDGYQLARVRYLSDEDPPDPEDEAAAAEAAVAATSASEAVSYTHLTLPTN